MANAFGRSLIAMGCVKYALRWPPYLRIIFVTLWQEVSTARMDIFGGDLEPSAGGSPSKRFWKEAKRTAEEMKACWQMDRQDVMEVSPTEGPVGNAKEHGTFGNWSSSEENTGYRPGAPSAAAAPSHVRFCSVPGSGAVTQAASAAPSAPG